MFDGKIYLVVLDVREGNINRNPQYGSWETYILSPSTQTQVLITEDLLMDIM